MIDIKKIATALIFSTSIFTLIFFYACAGNHHHNSQDHIIPLEQLISQAPTANRVQNILVYDAILTHGPEGIVEISRLLESADPVSNAQAEYILQGLAMYVNTEQKEPLRSIYVIGLNQSLTSDLSIPSKQFIISLLQIAGRDDAVPVISAFLNTEELACPAIRALTAIATESAAQRLLEAISVVKPDYQVAIITAVGTLKYEPAAVIIGDFLDDPSLQKREAAYVALSDLGYLPAAERLEQIMHDDHHFVPFFLRYAENIASRGYLQHAQTICQNIIENEQGDFTDNQQMAALYSLFEIDSTAAIDPMIKLAADEDRSIRMAALTLTANYNHPDVTDQLINLAKTSPASVQADIISSYAFETDSVTVTLLKESLHSSSSLVRKAAIQSYAQLFRTEALDDIAELLYNSPTIDEQYVIRQTITTYADTAFFNHLFNQYNQYPVNSQALIIRCMIELKNQNYNPIWVQSLNKEDSLLRSTVIEGMQVLGNDSALHQLIHFDQNITGKREEQAIVRAITAIFDRSEHRSAITDSLVYLFNSASDSNKIRLFGILRSVGGKKLLDLTYSAVSSSGGDLSDEAMRNLSLWPDDDCLDLLVQIARDHKIEKYRIIALQGILRLLREKQMDEIRALLFYKQIADIVYRTEEKRQFLAGLADLTTPAALELIIPMMKDSDVENEALLATMKVASSKNLTGKDIALTLLPNLTEEAIQKRISQYAQNEDSNNKPPEGFTALFNGQDLSGWKGLVADPVKRSEMTPEELQRAQGEADDLMKKHWKVIDGVLFFDGNGASLCTQKDYTDFELLVDWKIEKHGDSGIYLRSSPQVQIWDPEIRPIGSGGLYNNQKYPNLPLQSADHPIGEWNSFRIIMRGEKVTVYLNDILVVDNQIMENYWERDQPIYPSGQIELQAHFSPLYFRNIYIRELEPQPPLFNGPLFNGVDLDGWEIIGDADQSWQIKDSVLFTEGKGGGWLSTSRQFTDFSLSLEFRVTEGGNSGIFIRAPHNGDPAYTGIEVQVLDDYADKYADLKPWQYTGSLYGLQSPIRRVSKKAGQWQTMEISCRGPNITVTLNGVKIIDANMINFMIKEKDHPGIKRRNGYIGLQNHGSVVEYRHIQLKEY